MNKYYLHDGTQSSGPFDLEEIKTKKISKSTHVWCEGMKDWTTAGEVAELQKLLFAVPPVFTPKTLKNIITEPLNTIDDSKLESKAEKTIKILGLNKKHFIIVLGVLALIVFSLVFSNYQENRRADLDQKNGQTDAQNRQYNQNEIEAQNDKIAEQERIERERVEQERIEKERIEQETIANAEKQARDNRLLEIQYLLIAANTNLENAQKKLNEVATFQFFRTPNERNQQLNLVQNTINRLKTEIETLETEASALNQN
jgi:hypothetical protein